MKPFDLQAALDGEPVCTQDGRKVKDLRLWGTEEDLLCGIVCRSETREPSIHRWDLDGTALDYCENGDDTQLMMEGEV